MSEQERKEANFASLCKELYPCLEVAESVFIEALRKHGDEGLAMEEVANWQPWESSADLGAAANAAPSAKEPEVDNIERQRRELEKFERAKKEREKEREERDKEEARREEQIRLKEQAKLEAKEKQEEKARLAREEEIRRAREEQAILARIERERAKTEEELKAKILKEEEQRREMERCEKEKEKEEKEKRDKEEKERREKEEKEKREREEKEKERYERIEREAREKLKEKRDKEEKEKRENENKDKDKEDDKEVRDIIKELQDLKGMNVDFVGENAPPRVSIYVGKESDLSTADHEQIKNIFLKGVSEQEIRILDIATDREIQQFLKSSLKQDPLVFPIVCVDGQPIGSPADLFKMESAQIEKVLSSIPEDPLFHINAVDPNSEVHLGALNQVLSAGEYLASGVGSLLMLPVTALTWPFRSAPVDPDQMKGKNDREFDVIHTNWYWRSQWRIFRFSDTYVARLHPRHKDIRAAHQYDTFRLIQITDSKNIVFHYSDNCPPDYLHAKEEDVKEMVKVVVAKNEKVKVTREESQG